MGAEGEKLQGKWQMNTWILTIAADIRNLRVLPNDAAVLSRGPTNNGNPLFFIQESYASDSLDLKLHVRIRPIKGETSTGQERINLIF